MLKELLHAIDAQIYDVLTQYPDAMPARMQKLVASYYPDARVRKLYWARLNVLMGENTFANPGLLVVNTPRPEGRIEIGRNVSIAPGVVLVSESSPNNSPFLRGVPYVRDHLVQEKPVIVGDDVWLGAGAVILPGVTIGRGAIVAAGAVVVRDVPPMTIVAGVPARPLRTLTANDELEREDLGVRQTDGVQVADGDHVDVRVGAATTQRAGAHLRAGAVVGSECEIGENALVDGSVVIADRVILGPGARVCGAVTIEDDVRIGPNVTFADDPASHDPYPGTPSYELRFGRTVVRRGARIGAGATILPGLSIGAYAVVGPGALVNTPVPAYAVVGGNPARIMAYVDARRVTAPGQHEELPPLHARGARFCRFPMLTDPRGILSFGQIGDHLPFTPSRYFLITDVPDGKIRGEHAHYAMEEIVVCAKGSFRVVLDDGRVREDVLLDSPSVGLYIPPLMWRIPYAYSPDAVLLALTSSVYEPEDYIRDYGEFLRAAGVAPEAP